MKTWEWRGPEIWLDGACVVTLTVLHVFNGMGGWCVRGFGKDEVVPSHQQAMRIAEKWVTEGVGATGLDDGPYLPGKAPRKKPAHKTPEEWKAIRAKAWETRRKNKEPAPWPTPSLSLPRRRGPDGRTQLL